MTITRRFASPSDKHLADSDNLSLWGKHETGIRWKDINTSQCIVILGEGKCGKTHEFKRQDQLLKNSKHFSFFIPLEQLLDDDLLNVITREEDLDFKRWQNASKDDNAVFFLDAVDELKLCQGTLRKALKKIKNSIGNALSRSRFYISCRPNDWNEELDYRELDILVVEENSQENEVEIQDGEKAFTALISSEKSNKHKHVDKQTNKPNTPTNLYT